MRRWLCPPASMVHTPDIRALESEQSHLLMALDRVLAQEEQKESAARMARWLSLRGLVERAWSRVPGYRAHWQGYGFHPGMLQSWEDIVRLPMLEKETLRQADSATWQDSATAAEALDTRTSGSSGSPVRIRREAASLWAMSARNLLAYHGWCQGSPLANTLYFIDPTHHSIDHALAAQLRATVEETRLLSAFLPVEDQFRAVQEWRPDFISTYPSTIRNMAAHMKRQGQQADSVRLLHLTSESMDPLGERQVREAFPQARLVQSYTATEAGLIAWQCAEGSAFHVAEHGVLVEIVDEAGHPTQDVGRVVVTDLGNTASPVIRYAGLEDYAQWAQGPCSCGRPGPRLAAIEGRRVESLRLPDGALHTPYEVTTALSAVPGLEAYQLLQDDVLRFRLRRVAERQADEEELDSSLVAALRSVTHASVVCHVVREERIDPEPGARKVPLVRCLIEDRS
jgi:phenylacetate-CoA ligase